MKITLNTETLTKDWPLVEALMKGKTVQFYVGDKWCDYGAADSHIVFEFHIERRIKPETQFRPWMPEEVPMPCILRSKECHETRWMVLSVSKCGVGTSDAVGSLKDVGVCSFELLLNHNEHSTDNGKNWKPCGVEIL